MFLSVNFNKFKKIHKVLGNGLKLFFKSLTFIMPIIVLFLGFSTSARLKLNMFSVIINAIILICVVEIIALILILLLVHIYTKVNLKSILKYTIIVLITTLPLGSSYLALPINIKIFRKIFNNVPESIVNLVLTIEASINRCGSLLGILTSLIVSFNFFSVKIPLLNVILLLLLLPLISLGSPGIHGGTFIVSLPLITSILTVSSQSPAIMLSFAIFTGILTFIHVTLNTITNGYLTLIIYRKFCVKNF